MDPGTPHAKTHGAQGGGLFSRMKWRVKGGGRSFSPLYTNFIHIVPKFEVEDGLRLGIFTSAIPHGIEYALSRWYLVYNGDVEKVSLHVWSLIHTVQLSYADSGIANPLICPVYPLPCEGPKLIS